MQPSLTPAPSVRATNTPRPQEPELPSGTLTVLASFAEEQGFGFNGVACPNVQAGGGGDLCYRDLVIGTDGANLILGRPDSDLAWRIRLARADGSDFAIAEATKLVP